MRAPRLRGGIAGLLTVTVFLVVALAMKPAQEGAPAAQKPRPPRPAGKPLAMIDNLGGVTIKLGLKDTKPTDWDGEVLLSEGKLTELWILRGNVKGKVEGNQYSVRTVLKEMAAKKKMKKDTLIRPILHLTIAAPARAKVTLKTKHGAFTFALADLTPGTEKPFLDGQASVAPEVGALRLTGPKTEDDYPALARAPDGTIWLTYNEYTPGAELIKERVLAGNFELLAPTGHGDQVLLQRFDGKVWHPPLEVTEPGLSIWRPTVAVDKKGVVTVAWAQQVEDDWEIFYRQYTPAQDAGAKGKWSEVVRLTKTPGSDFHVVAAADARGTVWLAWQAWRDGHFQILVASLGDGPARVPQAVSPPGANSWSPAIAADSKGRVYVAYDTYAQGNYDVRLYVRDQVERTMLVADSPRFEARPHLVCDAQDRLWIAYEEGDEQWGKDYTNNTPKKVGLKANPGYPLYLNRTVRVKCLVGNKLQQPADDLEKALESTLTLGRSLPRLAADAAGGIWLLLRHHPLPGGVGEVWYSYALRYDGKKWGPPQKLGNSSNLLDNRPGLAPLGQGILTVYSSDTRQRTQNRDQDDLFAAILTPTGPTHAPPALAPDRPAPAAVKKAVHPNEKADVARMRAYRIEYEGKKLRLLRGEFHRHTAYTAHRDQDGLLEDAWRYALDAGNLDWMGNGDHDNGFGIEYFWWQIQKVADLFQHSPRFVAAHTYERSVVYPNGHRNVMMPKRGIRPLPRGVLKGTPEKGTPDTKVLYAYLKHFGGICASHTSATNMGTDWRDNDPLYEPVVEIYQGHRHNYEHLGAPKSATEETQIGGYEPAGFVWNAFEKGYRFGFQASSDHVSTHLSYAVVLTDDATRKGLIDAFKKRHCYAATDNILLDVRSGKQLMGDAFETDRRPALEIKVIGTGPIRKLSVVRNNKYVHTEEPKQREVTLRWTDMDPIAGKAAYYYVRIEQADGNLAWASPMWITYRPK
jgi:hypothetical protein